MLIIALVLAVIGLAALVAAVVTSNELIAWVCIGASVIGVLLLIADALRSRREGAVPDTETVDADVDADAATEVVGVQEYPEDLQATDTYAEPESYTEVDADEHPEAPEVSGAPEGPEAPEDPEAPADSEAASEHKN